MQYRIEKGIPLPHRVGSPHVRTPIAERYPAWPIEKMEVGDSFLLPNCNNEFTKIRAVLHARAQMLRNAQKSHVAFTIKIIGPSLRVWRTN